MIAGRLYHMPTSSARKMRIKISMKRIALFINSLQKGGSERVMVNLAEYFQSQKYDVILITQYKRDNEYELSSKIRRIYSEPEPESKISVSGFTVCGIFGRNISRTLYYPSWEKII